MHESAWLKAVAGRYHQPPRVSMVTPGVDTALELGLLSSTQFAVGSEVHLGKAADLDANVYFNHIDPLLFDVTNDMDTGNVQPGPGMDAGVPRAMTVARQGRSYGLEVLLRRRDADRWFGWLSYTLSRSERLVAQRWQPFDFDRRHIVNLVAGLRLPRNWELGARMLFQTGTPLDWSDNHPTRSDPYFRFDLRVDKRAVWNNWLLDFYVDVTNATVSAETGGILGETPVRYVIPTLGLRVLL
jgi:hypothetical protein